MPIKGITFVLNNTGFCMVWFYFHYVRNLNVDRDSLQVIIRKRCYFNSNNFAAFLDIVNLCAYNPWKPVDHLLPVAVTQLYLWLWIRTANFADLY